MIRLSDSDQLWPIRKVLQRYGVCARTIDRWIADRTLGFPRPVVINRRRYFRERQLEEWERRAMSAGRGPTNICFGVLDLHRVFEPISKFSEALHRKLHRASRGQAQCNRCENKRDTSCF